MTRPIFSLLLSLASISIANADYNLRLDLDRESGHYEVGQTVKFTVSFPEDGKIAPGTKIRYIMKLDAGEIKTGTFDADGKPKTFEYTGEKPSWVYVGLEVLDGDGKARTDLFRHRRKPTIVEEIGAIFSPEKIRAKPSKPDDFDAYWADQRAKLDAVPVKATLTPVDVPEKYRGKIECFGVSVDSSTVKPLTGYLAFPSGAKTKSLPARIDYQSLTWNDANKNAAITAASRGALALSVSWHGMPFGCTEQELRNDPVTGSKPYGRPVLDDRDRWFFRDTYIRAMRAVDYIKTRPEWNGKDIAVQGGSLGALQTVTAAVFDPAVTLAVIGVPSQCELNAFESGRRPGIPFRNPRNLKRLREEPAVGKTAAYFDLVNFAPAIKCEVCVSTGFTDESCYPGNVYAFYNAIPESTKKVITTNPRTGHYGTTANVKGNARLRALFRGVTVDDR